jgi:HK97 gp10 family phage protein
MSVVVMDTTEADRILQQAARKSITVTNRIAHEVLTAADMRVPVDTGALKASGAVEEATPGNETAVVSYGGDDVDYAVYQEFGTYKMKAQPYMQPAIESVSQKYADGKPYEEIVT